MKKEEKRMILILIIVGIIIITTLFLITQRNTTEEEKKEEVEQNITEEEQLVQELEDGTQLNISTQLNKEKEFQGLRIKNIQLTNKENKTELIADIENVTNQDTKAMLVDVILYDEQGNEITTLGGRISPIKAGKTMQFSISAMINYANAYDFKLQLK